MPFCGIEKRKRRHRNANSNKTTSQNHTEGNKKTHKSRHIHIHLTFIGFKYSVLKDRGHKDRKILDLDPLLGSS